MKYLIIGFYKRKLYDRLKGNIFCIHLSGCVFRIFYCFNSNISTVRWGMTSLCYIIPHNSMLSVLWNSWRDRLKLAAKTNSLSFVWVPVILVISVPGTRSRVVAVMWCYACAGVQPRMRNQCRCPGNNAQASEHNALYRNRMLTRCDQNITSKRDSCSLD